MNSLYISDGQSDLNHSALYFPDDSREYNISGYADENLTLQSPGPNRIVEHYKIAWTSYALVCENGSTDYCGDLYLYYNFSPVAAASLPATTHDYRALLLKNVRNFKFKGDGNTIRFKICVDEKIEDYNITACKEKAVF